MNRYLIVVHTWYVNSKGFYSKTITCKTDKEAEKEASFFAYEKQEPILSSAFHIIRLEDSEFIVNHKLSWKERFTGILNYF